jgi:predicted transcriptional regulator
MAASGVPEHVRQFLLAHIRSIEQLEVLLLLRAAPEREWRAEEVNSELGSSVASISGRLALLASEGLLAARGEGGRRSYRYEPTAASRATIDDLAAAYRERRLAVIEIVYERPDSDAASFSDAFKLTRSKEGK